MRKITHIVVHNTGSEKSTVESIRAYHKSKGWKDIGYHYVIYKDGTLHEGRPEAQPGAHVAGFNAHSIGVVCVGNGDIRDFTEEQYATMTALLKHLTAKHKVPVANVLGHRETAKLEQIKPAQRTKKTCPGEKVSMELIRCRLN